MIYILIRLEGIRKYYTTKYNITKVLDGVDLEINKGELLAVMGKSGCGKSTLLNILGGLISATDGNYMFDEKKIDMSNKNYLSEFRRKHISFIVQDFALIKERTVLENVELPLFPHKLSTKKRATLVYQYIEKIGLKGKERQYPDELSGGEQQRVAIARAMISNPSVILADEPTGSLDEENQIHILKMLKELAKGGTTIVLVTHDIDVANECDRCLHISEGKIKIN